MKRLNKLAAVFCVAAMALTAMTGCEGSDMFSVNSPDWLSEKIDSIEKANQSTEEVLVGMNEDVYTVGNTDFSSAFLLHSQSIMWFKTTRSGMPCSI